MPDNPFDLFDKVEAETKPLLKTIQGEEFEFPGAAPADIALRFYSALAVNPNVNIELLCVFLFEEMMGTETLEKLTKLTSIEGVEALATGLFRHYRLLSEPAKEATPPKGKGRPSKKRSSGVSA